MFNLSNLELKEFNTKYLNEIKSLFNSNEHIFINNSDLFWDKYKTKRTYKLILYFYIQFFKGNIGSTPGHCGPIENNHKDSCNFLERLALKGILTNDGQRSSVIDEQRSYLEFILPVEYKDINIKLNLLKELYKRGLNVFSTLHHNDEIIRKIFLFKSQEKTIYKLDAKKFYNLSVNLRELTKGYTHHPLKYLSSDYDKYLNINYPSKYIFSVSIYNQNWDLKQCDEILLNCILESEIQNYNFEECECKNYPSYMKCHTCEHYKYKLTHLEYKCHKHCNICNY